MRSPFLVALFAAVALGSPKANPTAFCSIVDKLVTAAHQTSQATAFCSSFLHITTSTAFTTVSTTTHTFSPAGCTAPAAKRTPGPRPEEVANIAAREPARRGKAPAPKPSCFKSYTAGALLSSACSCLSIPTATTTITTTTFTATYETPLTFHLSAAGVGYATVIDDGLNDQAYNVQFGGSIAEANNFYVDEDTQHPNLYLDAVPENDISLMFERGYKPGLLYFHILDVQDTIENVQCTVQGYPGTCYLHCVTGSNSSPDASGPFDGYAQEQICPPGNEWWLDESLNSGCSAFTPIVVPL